MSESGYKNHEKKKFADGGINHIAVLSPRTKKKTVFAKNLVRIFERPLGTLLYT